jgi:hypothetical protein
MRLPRMTTRRCIDTALVVVMVYLAILLVRQRRERFARLAWLYADTQPAVTIVDLAIAPKAERRRVAIWGEEITAWRAEMARKYKRAARYPWLPLAPDRPAPTAPPSIAGPPDRPL